VPDITDMSVLCCLSLLAFQQLEVG